MDRRMACAGRKKIPGGCDSFQRTEEENWWKENNTSLILTPDPIIEDIEMRKLKKKSLELAGVV